MAEETEAKTIADIAARSVGATHLKDTTAAEIMVFLDKSVLNLEKYADKPRRKRAVAALMDQESFAAYVMAHNLPGRTAIFGKLTEKGGSFLGVIDYHEKVSSPAPVTEGGDGAPFNPGLPQWGDHRATFDLGFTPEWVRWTGSDNQPLAQVDFAYFIEDNMLDIVDPSGADILEVAQELVAKKSVDFKSSTRLSNGETSLSYEEKIEAASKRPGDLKVPSEFTIKIAPFVGIEPSTIKVRLRFRITDGRLLFIYKMDRPHKVVEAAFSQARDYIKTKTGLPVLLGGSAVTPI